MPPRGITRPHPPTNVPGRDEALPTPPNSDGPTGDTDTNKEEQAPEADVVASLATALERAEEDKKFATTLDPFKLAARWFCRGIDPFLDVTTVFHYGIQSKGDPNEVPQGYEVYNLDERRKLIRAFQSLLAQVPNYEHELSTLQPNMLKVLINISSNASKDSRSDDTSNCKRHTQSLAMEDMRKPLTPAVLPQGSKAERGFNHDELTFMLAPMKLVHRYRKDNKLDELREELKNGAHSIISGDYPAFLYEKNGEGYQEESIDGGLFRGYFLVRMYKLIFLGPTSAARAAPGKGTGKRKAVAEKHHLKVVTSRTIAYAALQARHSLSTMEQWDHFDGDFDNEEFYNNIVEDLEGEDADLEWSKDTLEWFNRQVFGTSSVVTETVPDSSSGAPRSAREELLLQRRNRRAQQA